MGIKTFQNLAVAWQKEGSVSVSPPTLPPALYFGGQESFRGRRVRIVKSSGNTNMLLD